MHRFTNLDEEIKRGNEKQTPHTSPNHDPKSSPDQDPSQPRNADLERESY